MHGSEILDYQIANSASSVIQSRKRRMEWDSIDLPQQKSSLKGVNENFKDGERKISRGDKTQGEL